MKLRSSFRKPVRHVFFDRIRDILTAAIQCIRQLPFSEFQETGLDSSYDMGFLR